jgi:beta-lactam-binding protein with PASTA domain
VEAGLPLSRETATAATAVLSGVRPTQATQVLSAPPTTPLPRQPVAPRRPPPPYPPTYDREEPPRRRRRWLPWLIVLLLFAALGAGGWYAYTQLQDELGSSDVAVPNVVGIDQDRARALLEADGFEVVERRTASLDVRRGFVADQRPVAGTRIPEGDPVTILISIGPPRVEVPDVVGETYANAFQILRGEGFSVRREDRFSPDVPEGDVIRQDPRPGVRAVEGSAVTLFVSRGQELAVVPDVVGLDRQSAETELQNAGFQVDAVEEFDDSEPGTVVAQNPSGDTEAVKGSTVQITVSQGPETAEVPDVVNEEQQTAEDALQEAGFEVDVVEEPTDDPTKDGVVLEQDPAASEQAEIGSTVTIRVGVFGGGD